MCSTGCRHIITKLCDRETRGKPLNVSAISRDVMLPVVVVAAVIIISLLILV